MSSPNSTDPFEVEVEIDLTGEAAVETPEQRRSSRHETASSLIGTVEFRDKRLSVRITDLSLSGAGITLDSRLPFNQECKLTIRLSVCGSDYELTMQCRVRYCDAVNSTTYHAGLQFVDMPQSTRDTLSLLTVGQ
ncbi:MAG TPA: PilZ domain-containing protein [Steroidobacteraceae bacterium]